MLIIVIYISSNTLSTTTLSSKQLVVCAMSDWSPKKFGDL